MCFFREHLPPALLFISFSFSEKKKAAWSVLCDTMSERAPHSMLHHLLSGAAVTPEAFLAEYWQQKPLHVANKNSQMLAELFHVYDIEEMWSSVLHGIEVLGDAEGGFLFFSDTGVQTKVQLNPFYAYANGCSVVVNRSDLFSRKILDLCERLERDWPQFPIACCNIYLTPPRMQSVPKHSDDRDVLLLQVYGEKEWYVYNAPIPLPYRDEELGKGIPIDPASLETPQVFRVRQGDVLYMPRGVVHEAKTADGVGSLHLTVALQTSDWDYGTLCLSAVKRALRTPRMVSSRRCVNLAALHSGNESAIQDAEREWQSMVAALFSDPHLITIRDSLEPFQQRISTMKASRQASVERAEVVAPAPVLLSSLIMWNACVKIVGVEMLDDPNMPLLKYLIYFHRQAAGGSGRGDMRFAVSEELLQVVQYLERDCRECSVSVRHLPLADELQKICAAVVLINNNCCLRAT